MLALSPRRVGGIAAVAAVAVAAFGVSALTNTASASPTPPAGFTDAGRLVIETSRGPITGADEFTKSSGKVSYFAPGATTATTSIVFDGGRNCQVTTSVVASLLTLAPTGGTVGLRDAGLGVRTKNNCSRDGGRIDVGEVLTISPGTSLLNAHVRRAELDIEGKGNADLAYKLDGGATLTADLAAGSDNGPDSGQSDNTRVVIDPATPFRSIALFPSGGSGAQVSLEGGGDFATAADQALNRTVLYLVQEGYEVDCGGTLSVAFTGAARSATYTRATDAFKGASCQKINVVLTLDSQGRLLLDTVGTVPADQELSGTIEIEWIVDRYTAANVLKTAAQINDELAREIDFDPGEPAQFEPVQWCVSSADTTNPTAPWCLISDHQDIEAEHIVQTQIYVGEEDPMWR